MRNEAGRTGLTGERRGGVRILPEEVVVIVLVVIADTSVLGGQLFVALGELRREFANFRI